MNTIFHNELRERYKEIHNNAANDAIISKVIDAYNRVLYFDDLARKEGLLALDEACGKLDPEDSTQVYLKRLITLVIEGTDPQIVKEIGMNMIISGCFHSDDGLICLMYYKAGILIQRGEHPLVVKHYMKSILPDYILNPINKAEAETEAWQIKKKKQELIYSLCEDDCLVDEKDVSIVNQTAITFLVMSDKDIQRLLREISNQELAVAMKGMAGKARARIFDNMSERLGIMIAEDISYMGPARLCDAEEACINILKKVIMLVETCEIRTCDLSNIDAAIEMYETV